MTGFGAAEGPVAGGTLRVEIRSVNHRFLTLTTRLPEDLAGFESECRDQLRRGFERGHLTLGARWVSAPADSNGAGSIDPERARAAATRLRELQAAAGIAGEIPLELVLRQPDVLNHRDGSTPAGWAEIESVVAGAIGQCRDARVREGMVLKEELRERLEAISGGAERVRALAPARLLHERDRLRRAIAQLLDGKPVDDQRLSMEIALLAERHDVTEELVRLDAHVSACREALEAPGSMGKQLGFLAQELGREMNTIGSKANDHEIQHAVVAMKGELERFREQLENLE
jgi:uncharacterized protein (TIGR00255 family)